MIPCDFPACTAPATALYRLLPRDPWPLHPRCDAHVGLYATPGCERRAL